MVGMVLPMLPLCMTMEGMQLIPPTHMVVMNPQYMIQRLSVEMCMRQCVILLHRYKEE